MRIFPGWVGAFAGGDESSARIGSKFAPSLLALVKPRFISCLQPQCTAPTPFEAPDHHTMPSVQPQRCPPPRTPVRRQAHRRPPWDRSTPNIRAPRAQAAPAFLLTASVHRAQPSRCTRHPFRCPRDDRLSQLRATASLSVDRASPVYLRAAAASVDGMPTVALPRPTAGVPAPSPGSAGT